uniref:Uncharacterized protein n=1 Tax=Anguilla anguilla TaxID=7936 RepID=A0A0E9PHY9_ANGAN
MMTPISKTESFSHISTKMKKYDCRSFMNVVHLCF